MVIEPTMAPPVPPALVDPTGTWFFNWVIPIVGGVVIALAVADSIRRRRLTWGFLFLFNSMLVYWMESIGDWGQELIYSPTFARHHLVDWLPLKTPNDPLFMPFAYAVYWTVHALAVLWLGQLLAKRFHWSTLKAILVLAIPVNYAWDFLVEGMAAAMGWWTYDPGMGPTLTFGNGGRITLLWSIGLMCFWPNLIAYWAGKPPVGGLNHFERFFGLERFTRPKVAVREPASVSIGSGAAAMGSGPYPLREQYDDRLNYDVTIPRWKFELARFGAWFAVFQVSFFLLLIVPLVTMRMITGHGSVYAP
jgi:hypothetical protein